MPLWDTYAQAVSTTGTRELMHDTGYWYQVPTGPHFATSQTCYCHLLRPVQFEQVAGNIHCRCWPLHGLQHFIMQVDAGLCIAAKAKYATFWHAHLLSADRIQSPNVCV